MFAKSLLIYTLSLTLGIGAATYAKTLLIEQALQEAAQTEELAYRTGLPKRRYQMSSKVSYAPNQWQRWTV